MSIWRLKGRTPARVWGAIGALWLGGCGGFWDTVDARLPRPTLNLSTVGIGDDSTYFETFKNNAFEEAEWVPVESEPRVIRGRIDGPSDVDLYDLGPVTAGTRIVVDMTADATLDGALALFDDTASTLLVNDHRNSYLGRKEPFIDVVTRRASSACYVAVSATPGYSALGDYALQASVHVPTPIPGPRSETVLLVFDGGSSVKIGGRSAVSVPRFDAADIDPAFAGQTSRIAANVAAEVRRDYAGLDVTIYSTSEGASWDGFMTRVFFGTFDPGLLGVAEAVDEYNRESTQNAIVFTDTFAAFSQLEPTVEEISAALANVASHEIGHLLGLVHTADPEGIMDVTASLNRLLIDQDFRQSPLYDELFPVGNQNALQLLMASVGGDIDLDALKQVFEAQSHSRSFDHGPPARDRLLLGTCGLDHAGH